MRAEAKCRLRSMALFSCKVSFDTDGIAASVAGNQARRRLEAVAARRKGRAEAVEPVELGSRRETGATMRRPARRPAALRSCVSQEGARTGSPRSRRAPAGPPATSWQSAGGYVSGDSPGGALTLAEKRLPRT